MLYLVLVAQVSAMDGCVSVSMLDMLTRRVAGIERLSGSALTCLARYRLLSRLLLRRRAVTPHGLGHAAGQAADGLHRHDCGVVIGVRIETRVSNVMGYCRREVGLKGRTGKKL